MAKHRKRTPMNWDEEHGITKRERTGLWAAFALLIACIAILIYDPSLRRCQALGGTQVINGRCMIVTESRMLVPWHPQREE